MSKATATAAKVISKYFALRGCLSPEEQAASFLKRVTLTPSGRWRSDDLADTAAAILEASAFDVDDLAENFLHLDLSIEPLNDYDSKAGAQVFGLANPREREIVICERAERYLPLYRTSVAHETGHILLHGGLAQAGSFAYSPDSKRRPSEESEADEFMVALLAPRSVVLLGVSLATHQAGLHIGDVLRRAISTWGLYQWRHWIFPCLVDRLCLSRELLSIQMRRYGIFDDATVSFHRTYAMPNRWRTA
jgi:Zn-dependent peptidase ImmA (M78 family)